MTGNKLRRGKPLKRLNSNVKNTKLKYTPNRNQRSSARFADTNNLHHQPGQGGNYQTELANFIALRHSDPKPSTSTLTTVSAIPSSELIWVRDESDVKPSAPLTQNPIFQETVLVDDEIEEGEIVESEVAGIVNLLEESFAAVRHSQRVVDFASPSKLFYEDRSTLKSGSVPQYTTFGGNANEETVKSPNVSDEVICLDSTQSDIEDSVIFVSEEKPLKVGDVPALAAPDCLKSPVVKKLLNLVPPQLPSTARKTPSSRNTPKRKQRIALWKMKKAVQFAEINAANGKKAKPVKAEEPKPSTSTELIASPEPLKDALVDEKRIVLIDGSNVAMAFTDNYGAKKAGKDFSAEG